jgi:hypothetical protein
MWAACRSLTGSQSFLGLGVIPDSRRAVPVRAPFTCSASFVPRMFPDPEPMRMPTKKALRWALFLGTLNRMRGIEMRALYGSWACVCAAARGSVSALLLVPDRALASVDGISSPFLFRPLVLAFTRPSLRSFFSSFLLSSFYDVPTADAPLGLLRICPPPVATVWMVGCVFILLFFFYFVFFHSLRSCLLRRVGVLYVHPFSGLFFCMDRIASFALCGGTWT